MNGYVLVDKPAGPTSFDVVRAIRKQLPRGTKVGHNGTLDPFATGLLIVLVGSATRLMQWLVGHDKRYLLGVQFGVESDSDDCTGTLKTITRDYPAEDAVREAVTALAATTSQVPPQVSALHIDGERAYKKAKRGEIVEVAARPVTFHSIDVVSYDVATGVLTLDVTSSSGTYMRSVARDLGLVLQCGGHAASLRRLDVGEWSVADAVTLDTVDVERDIKPMANLLQDKPLLILDESEVQEIRHGRTLPTDHAQGLLRLTDATGEIVAIAEVLDGVAQPRVVVA